MTPKRLTVLTARHYLILTFTAEVPWEQERD